MLNVAFFYFHTECHTAECHSGECHSAKCQSAKCRGAKAINVNEYQWYNFLHG
jgi:hypothetical protein